MPRKNQETGIETPANKQKGKKRCTCCRTEQNLTNFYLSYSPMYSLDKRVPICKECCKSSCLNNDGTINMRSFKSLLRQIDKPLYFDNLDSAEKSIKKENSYLSDDELKYRGKEIVQKYFTLIAMRQDRTKSFSDSESEGFMHHNNNRTEAEKSAIINKYLEIEKDEGILPSPGGTVSKIIYTDDTDFIVTDEMIDLFGDGYTPSLYKKMFEKYEKLKINYTLQTNIHQEALATYVRFKVQEEIETAKGNVTEAKKWYDAAQSAAQDAKLTPKQLTKADFDSGINSISELTKAVEQAVDVIKILPRFKYRPNDAPDFNIWCYIDYERKLNDQPPISYEEVYQFYDKKRDEYIAQNGDPYGIFTNEPTMKNRETVKTFIKLPSDYEDMAGEENG